MDQLAPLDSRGVILRDPDSPSDEHPDGDGEVPFPVRHNGRLCGVYENYLLVRPYPSLRILFTSLSMRVPGILQSPLLQRVGGLARIRDQLVQALAVGQGVTAKVKWLRVTHRVGSRPPRKKMQYNHPLEAGLEGDDHDAEQPAAAPEQLGRSRWLHCPPLVGANGKVGVWVVIVDDEPGPGPETPGRAAPAEPHRPRTAAPGAASDPGRVGPMPDGWLRVRTRRSSETLGSTPKHLSLESRDVSVTQAIHHQHAATTSRSPTSPARSTSVPPRFCSPAARSPARPTPTASLRDEAVSPLDTTHHRQVNGKVDAVKGEEATSETSLPTWPRPRNPLSRSRRKRAHQLLVPRVIQETYHNDGDIVSTQSSGSAFTVRIND